jgi:haloacetate dehalogenase
MLLPEFDHREIDTGEVTIHTRVAGSGPPLLLLHGYPQTHVCWHKVAPELAKHFTVVLTDLRGYGDSSKPPGNAEHSTYCKRTMARDQVGVMKELGFEKFQVAGHDRGGRVAHRMALDFPEAVERWAVLDIAPTLATFEHADQRFARVSYHWFFLSQPYDLPERLIGADPEFFLRWTVNSWAKVPGSMEEKAIEEYLRCFCTTEGIHASCEDYRAAASIDLEHDRADLHRKVGAPLLALWGAQARIGKLFDVLGLWRERVADAQGHTLPGGHFLPEECPKEVTAELLRFFRH